MKNICIVTRPDLKPTNHGAAVKILRTAQSMIRMGAQCWIVTADRECYWSVSKEGDLRAKPFAPKTRSMEEWLFFGGSTRRAEWICRLLGYPIEEWFLYSPQFDTTWLLRLVAVGLVEDIDVFQAEFPGYAVMSHLASRIVQMLRGQPVQSILVQHNVEWARLKDFGFQTRWIQKCERVALQIVDDVIAVSAEDKQLMMDMGVRAEKITIIPHGVNWQEIQLATQRRDELRIRWGVQDKVVVFFHGTLHYSPNTDAVRFIAQQLLPKIERLPALDSVQFVIVGMNPPKYFAHERITFTDAVEDLAGHLHMADVFLCPLFDGGGTRMKLLEYMAVGKPILTTVKGAEGIPNLGQFQYVETAQEMLDAVLAYVSQIRQEARAVSEEQANKRVQLAQKMSWDSIGQCYLELMENPHTARGRNFYQAIWSNAEHHRVQSTASEMNDGSVDSATAFLPSTYRPAKARTLLLLINRGCNLTCAFCDLWENPEYMPLDRVKSLLHEAVKIQTKTVVITGGEPLMHPELEAVVQEAVRFGLAVNITTNGLLVKRHWHWLQSSGVASLSFSLDGLEEVHDRLRGQKGAFARTMKAIELVRSRSEIPCSVYCTVTNQNVHQLYQLYSICKALGVNFDFWPVNDAPELYLRTEQEQQEWREQVQRILEDSPTFAKRQTFYRDALTYHAEEPIQNRRCLGFVEQYGVRYNGDFMPCCVWGATDLIEGNVFETPLSSLWNSDSVQKVRQQMVKVGCQEPCFNHSLYEYRQAIGEGE